MHRAEKGWRWVTMWWHKPIWHQQQHHTLPVKSTKLCHDWINKSCCCCQTFRLLLLSADVSEQNCCNPPPPHSPPLHHIHLISSRSSVIHLHHQDLILSWLTKISPMVQCALIWHNWWQKCIWWWGKTPVNDRVNGDKITLWNHRLSGTVAFDSWLGGVPFCQDFDSPHAYVGFLCSVVLLQFPQPS